MKNKRILIISALYPPDVIGGAEMSAASLAQWMNSQGLEVGVLTTAKNRRASYNDKNENGIRVWRKWALRPYPIFNFSNAPKWLKPLWHLLDHFAPQNKRMLAKVLDDFKPDFINIHVLQGIGYNALTEITKRKIPVLYTLHDLGLACIRMSMFKNGTECKTQCAVCKISSDYKSHLAAQIPQLGYCSPSQANLSRLSHFFPITKRPHTAILNANAYPDATVERTSSDVLRILFVGRIHVTKGIQLLLEACLELVKQHKLHLTIVGSGPDEAELRTQYGMCDWVSFKGFLNHAEISNLMVNSDMLCVPSLWLENSPGVAIHALSLGLPVIASNKGGIPELVEDGKNGALFDPDAPQTLSTVLEKILNDRSQLERWREHALATRMRFNQDSLGKAYLAFMEKIMRS